MSTLNRDTRSSSVAGRRLVRAGLMAAAAAALANAVVFVMTIALGVDSTGPFMGPDGPPVALALPQVVVASSIPSAGATFLLWALARFTRQPRRYFVAIAAVAGVLSLAGPLTLPVSTALQVSLALMHVVAAVTITTILARQSGTA